MNAATNMSTMMMTLPGISLLLTAPQCMHVETADGVARPQRRHGRRGAVGSWPQFWQSGPFTGALQKGHGRPIGCGPPGP